MVKNDSQIDDVLFINQNIKSFSPLTYKVKDSLHTKFLLSLRYNYIS